jgi:hypothetical protein
VCQKQRNDVGRLRRSCGWSELLIGFFSDNVQ